jgi:hypothetical protein
VSDLVERLSTGRHVIEAALRPDKTAAALQQCVHRGYVIVRFPNTRGGTDLGVTVEPEKSDFTEGDFANQRGTVRIVGHLELDFVPVRCTAELDLATLSGEGWLERLEPPPS